MCVHRLAVSAVALALVTFGLANLKSLTVAQNVRVDANVNDNNAQVLTHGPVHEGFGQPVTFNAIAGLTVAKQPPAPIEEMPPDQKPEGDNVAWIPGYWGWDASSDSFLWVSGFWRRLPPGRQWIPGYWTQVDKGYQWVSGYWAPATQTEVTYLPQPPESVEAGPSTAAPGDTYIWVPGCWVWTQNHYAWRPGHWIADQQGWVWCPAEYYWTPGGYVFVDGYWDYSPRQRGLLFAPVLFNAVVLRPGFVWTPTVVIDTNLLTDFFFAWPRYHHYCFGDYYAANFLNVGIYPWFAFHQSHYGYDPIFAYYSTWYGRTHRNWLTQQRQDYFARRDNANLRPPRTFAAQQALVSNRTNIQNAQSLTIAQPLTQVVKEAGTERMPLRFEHVDKARLTDVTKHQAAVRKVATERQQTEVQLKAAKPAATEKAAPPLRRELPQTPLVHKAGPATAKAETPPAAPKAPAAQTEAKVPAKPVTRPRPEEHLQQLQKNLPPVHATPPPPQRPQGAEPKPQARPAPPPAAHEQPKAPPPPHKDGKDGKEKDR
jgi:hypothetical protein